MSKLAICNVGPIKNGLGRDEYISFDGLTVITGIQGSGKSTIAKVYSSLCWLEKSLVREDVSLDEANNVEFFLDDVMSFQGISEYFSDKSFVHFIGSKYEFKLDKNIFSISERDNPAYSSPKIMYVPAERNFLTSIVRPELISKLPRALHAFLAEYEEAKDYIRSKLVDLPIGKLKYQYEPDDGSSYLVGEGFKTNLINGSSGYQSLVPLFLVTEYLSDFISNQNMNGTDEHLNVALQRRITKEFQKAFSSLEHVKNRKVKDFILTINQIRKRFTYSAFINVVEEPEQNLYPDSQKSILFELLKALNKSKDNRLVITTHSPYIVSFLTLNFMANRLFEKELSDTNFKQVSDIVPRASTISPSIANVYECNGGGSIEKLDIAEGFIPDDNKLNYKFEEINEQFSSLLYMEE
ncbi:AAA family ATPase [Shewanella cyperi]|uniref:AAA family ATPase n=1 Tax=Shewanella cyperi TaxID=2814292 RepID=UPI001A9494FB|nr:AAA family ATPase [Shewanella cyperi]QSX41828.1 AAA family ATPase [Shewanella cyperi]